MRVIFVAAGSEMLDLDKVDTNSLYIAKKLREKGILIDMKMVVGDNADNLSWVIKNGCKRAQLVIVTGGLGPTEDDVTREAAARALKKDLEFQEEIVDDIRARFKQRGLSMPDINARQGFVISGAELLVNRVGTAPGQFIEDERCQLLLLPGPPEEMKPMFDEIFEKRIAPQSNFFIYQRVLKFGGITESETDSAISGIYSRIRQVSTTILARPGLIEIHLMGRARNSPDEAREQVEKLAGEIKQKLQNHLICEQDLSVEEVIVDKLVQRSTTISVAESCTGGGLGNLITNVPGSSRVFLGGIIAYSDKIKHDLLDVSNETLKKFGAVSKETAREMAHGIRKKTGSDIAVSITGIAGPAGATRGKPLGLVFMHICSAERDLAMHKIFPGQRETVKIRTIYYTMNMIKDFLLAQPGDTSLEHE